MHLDHVLAEAVGLGASDIHLKLGRPPLVRRNGDIEPLDHPELTEHDLLSCLSTRHRRNAAARAAVPRVRRPRPRLHLRRPASLPCQRLPPARRDVARAPRDPARGAEVRPARAAAGGGEAGRRAPRARPGHGRDRLGEDDDARRDARPHQPDAALAHRHDRGPARDPPLRPRVDREPARGRPRHRELRAGPPPRAPPGSRHDHDRRAPRRRDRADGAPGRRVRATSSSRPCTRSTPPRRSAA